MKKVFVFFAVACLAITMFSCSDEVEETKEKGGLSLALKIEKSAFSRAIQAPGATGLNINSMIIELFDGSKMKLGQKVLSAAEIAGATAVAPGADDGSRIVVEGVDARAVYAKIWAYQKAGVSAVNDLAPTNSINLYQYAFNEIPFHPVQQAAGGNLYSTTDADGFVSINKNMGVASNPGSGTHAGHLIWTVQAKLAPYFARLEVAPAVGGIRPDVTSPDGFPAGTTFTVTGIYVNNINDVVNATSITKYVSNMLGFPNGDWEAAGQTAYAVGGSWSNMCNLSGGNNATTALAVGTDCYNLFAQSMGEAPHITVRVWVDQPNGAIGGDYYGFVTIKDYTITSGGLPSGKLSAVGIQTGKIYQIDLSALRELKPTEIKPDPENTPTDLYAQVEIVDWTIVTATPDLD